MIYRLFTKLTFQFLYCRRLHSLQMFLECEDMVVHFHYILIFCEQSLRQRSFGIVTLFAPVFYKVFGSDTFFLCFPAGRVESAECEAAKTSRGGFRLGQ